jgi:hypothetical protein
LALFYAVGVIRLTIALIVVPVLLFEAPIHRSDLIDRARNDDHGQREGEVLINDARRAD